MDAETLCEHEDRLYEALGITRESLAALQAAGCEREAAALSVVEQSLSAVWSRVYEITQTMEHPERAAERYRLAAEATMSLTGVAS